MWGEGGEEGGREGGREGEWVRGRNFLVYHRDLVWSNFGCVRKRRMRIRREKDGKKGEAEMKGRRDGGRRGGREGRSVHYMCSFKLHARK